MQKLQIYSSSSSVDGTNLLIKGSLYHVYAPKEMFFGGNPGVDVCKSQTHKYMYTVRLAQSSTCIYEVNHLVEGKPL